MDHDLLGQDGVISYFYIIPDVNIIRESVTTIDEDEPVPLRSGTVVVVGSGTSITAKGFTKNLVGLNVGTELERTVVIRVPREIACTSIGKSNDIVEVSVRHGCGKVRNNNEADTLGRESVIHAQVRIYGNLRPLNGIPFIEGGAELVETVGLGADSFIVGIVEGVTSPSVPGEGRDESKSDCNVLVTEGEFAIR